MSNAIFVTGTDTDIGKTIISAGLCRALRIQGYDVGCCKPFATGEPVSSDAQLLMKASGTNDPMRLVNPCILSHPLAPYSAAHLEGKLIDVASVTDTMQEVIARHTITVVEGVGGIMVPLQKDYFLVDFITDSGLPCIVVAGSRLGTVNHTLMTLRLLQDRKIAVLGVVMNGYNDSLTARCSYKAISDHTDIPILARLAHDPAYRDNPDLLAGLLTSSVDLDALVRRAAAARS